MSVIYSPFETIPANITRPEVDGVYFNYRLPPEVANLLIRFADLASAGSRACKGTRITMHMRETVRFNFLGQAVLNVSDADAFVASLIDNMSHDLISFSNSTERKITTLNPKSLHDDFQNHRELLRDSIAPLIRAEWNAASIIGLPLEDQILRMGATIVQDRYHNTTFAHTDPNLLNLTAGVAETSEKVFGSWLYDGKHPHMFPHLGEWDEPGWIKTSAAMFKGTEVNAPHNECIHSPPAFTEDEVWDLRPFIPNYRYYLSIFTKIVSPAQILEL